MAGLPSSPEDSILVSEGARAHSLSSSDATSAPLSENRKKSESAGSSVVSWSLRSEAAATRSVETTAGSAEISVDGVAATGEVADNEQAADDDDTGAAAPIRTIPGGSDAGALVGNTLR